MSSIEKLFATNKMLKDNYLKDCNNWEKINFHVKSFIYNNLGVWDVWDIMPYSWQRFYYDKIKTIFNPYHARIRKSIARQWSDLSHVMVDVNFEIIKSFYEDEYSKGFVNWDSDEYHQKFAKWLESAYKYITVERSQLEKQMDAAYPEANLGDMFDEPETDKNGLVTRRMKTCEERYGKSYEEVYKEVNRLESLINETDTKVLIEMIKNRDFFWT